MVRHSAQLHVQKIQKLVEGLLLANEGLYLSDLLAVNKVAQSLLDRKVSE